MAAQAIKALLQSDMTGRANPVGLGIKIFTTGQDTFQISHGFVVAGHRPEIALSHHPLHKLFGTDRKSTRLNPRHYCATRMPSSARNKNKHNMHIKNKEH